MDTTIYSQSGKEIFVIYAQQFEPNHLGNDLDPAYLWADERDSIYWHLQDGTPNAEQMSGSYHNITDLKKAVRQFYFNQYSFLGKDSSKKNYFWNQVILGVIKTTANKRFSTMSADGSQSAVSLS